MNITSDPRTALVLARYHQDFIRESFPRRRHRSFSFPLSTRSRRLTAVPAAHDVGADRRERPQSGSAAA